MGWLTIAYRSIAVQTMTSLTGVNVIQYYQSELVELLDWMRMVANVFQLLCIRVLELVRTRFSRWLRFTVPLLSFLTRSRPNT